MQIKQALKTFGVGIAVGSIMGPDEMVVFSTGGQGVVGD